MPVETDTINVSSPDLIAEAPLDRFELKKTGPDLLDHKGIEWVYLTCPHCSTYCKFQPKYTLIANQPEDPEGVSLREFHSIATCDFCNGVIYVKCWEIDFDPDWHFAVEYYHPQASFSHSPANLPPSVFSSYEETHKCYCAGAYLATVVMCRRTIEAILHDKGVDRRLTLAKGLEKVARDATLHESMVEIADVMRLVGNQGAHAGGDDPVKQEQAREAYVLTGKLVEMIYVLPARSKALRAKVSTTPHATKSKGTEPPGH
jgi:hypothetical protein